MPSTIQKPKLRILLATEYLPPYVSGIANRCKNLIKGYRSSGHQVTVYGLKGTEADVIVPSIANPLYNQQRAFIFPPLLLLLNLLNPFKSINYDIVHLFGPLCLPFIPLLPLFKLRGVKVYVSYHVYLEYYKECYFSRYTFFGLFSLKWLGEILQLLYVWIYFIPYIMWADCVGIPSKTADFCVFKYCRNIHVMKSGLDPDVFTPTIRGKGLLVYIGRLAVEKNISFLLKALATPQLSDKCLMLVGDGPERAALEAEAKAIVGVNNVVSIVDNQTPEQVSRLASNYRVVFVGMVYNEYEVAEYYSAGDCFVSASASETFGFTVAEALSCGTPAAVVRSGAFEVVYKCIDQDMFQENDIQDYANKVVQCIKGGESKRRASRKLAVDHFSVHSAIENMLSKYSQIVWGDYSRPLKNDSDINEDERKHLLEIIEQ